MERMDIAIIGTGPAGVSAAITAKIRNKKVLLLGSSELSEKMAKAHEINNYPGFPAVKGEDLVKAFQRHLKAMDISVTEKRVAAVYAMGDYFAIQAGEDMLEARSVILAGGVVQGKPLEGEERMLGRGVSYCATCDAPLYRGKTAAVVGYSPREETEAAFLSEVCEKVFYFPVYACETDLPAAVEVIREKVTGLGEADGKRLVNTEQGSYPVDGIFVLREAVAPGQLVPGLATDGPHVVVNLQMETNIPGVFACGDIAGKPYQYVKAAGEGNIAALSAVAWLDAQNKK